MRRPVHERPKLGSAAVRPGVTVAAEPLRCYREIDVAAPTGTA